MKIKFLSTTEFEGNTYQAGDEFEVSDEVGSMLIEAKEAESMDGASEEKKEESEKLEEKSEKTEEPSEATPEAPTEEVSTPDTLG